MKYDFVLIKADFEIYLNQYTVYKVQRDNNRFNLGEESIRMSIEDDKEFCTFIYEGETQVGGVIFKNSSIKHLFMLPGYSGMTESVIRFLHRQLTKNIQTDKGISCLPSNSTQAGIFLKLGYKTVRKMRCMLGPVKNTGWKVPDGYTFERPREIDAKIIAQLFYEANIEEPWHQPVTRELFQWGTNLYFNKSKTRQLLNASTVCFDDSTGLPVGACLVSEEEGFPFVFDIHILKNHRRRGIATAMMQRAVSKVSGCHSFMRLFVIEGNPAEYMYEKLGFISGNPVYIMKYVHGD